MSMNRRGFLIASTASAGLAVSSFSVAGRTDASADADTPSTAIALPNSVRNVLASRSHRLHHLLWHGLRDDWTKGDVSDASRKSIQALKWNPPRPAARWLSDGWMPETTNGSGVDFLYMHREMISEFDKEMAKAGVPSNIGWQVIPEPGHTSDKRPGIEVPREWNLPENMQWLQRRFAALKSDEYYWSRMRWWDREFHNHAYLRTLTLGQLGSLLETSVHNDMHMRWAAPPIDPQTNAIEPLGRPENSIDPKWDAPSYDYLGETYSSHVNPVFWRLHKWVDGIIDEWFDAHEIHSPGEISKVTLNGINWYASDKWIETDQPWSSPDAHAHHDVATMEKVFRLLYPSSRTFSAERASSAPRSWFK